MSEKYEYVFKPTSSYLSKWGLSSRLKTGRMIETLLMNFGKHQIVFNGNKVLVESKKILRK